MNKAGVIVAALLLGVAPAFGVMGPPTDEEIATAIASFAEKTKGLERNDREGRIAAAKEVAGALDVQEMSVDQIQKLGQSGILGLLDQRERINARLAVLSREKTADGARAAVLRVSYVPTPAVEGDPNQAREAAAKARAEATAEALQHPGLAEALKEGQATEIFGQLSPYSAAAFVGLEPKLAAVEKLLTPDLPPAALARASSLIDFYGAEQLSFDAAARERIRARLSSLFGEALENLPADDKARASLERGQNYIDGAFARGQLVNHTAPELDFIWSNAKEPIKTLADLRGKVVVIDFWATWCGPCIGSFPQVRDLVKHYEGYPVVVLGVTSIQGSHIDQKEKDPAKRRIDTKGDPDREMSLMTGFISDMEMTWPVAFSKQEVFNPDYGVRGIPHVVIIDPKGVVRHRGLHPASPLAEKTNKIDALLQEAGLPAPAAVEEAGAGPSSAN